MMGAKKMMAVLRKTKGNYIFGYVIRYLCSIIAMGRKILFQVHVDICKRYFVMHVINNISM